MNEAEQQHRKETIEKILEFNANEYTRDYLDERNPKTGKKYSNAELDVYWATLQTQAAIDAENRLAKAQAERAADTVMFQLERAKQTEPQRTKQLAHDRQTFVEAAKKLRTFGVTEANFNFVRQALGAGFTLFGIQQALSSLQLSPPSRAEWDQWAAEAIEQHNHQLLNATDSELRQIVKQEQVDRQQATQQEQATRELESAQQRDQYRGYRPLPPEIDAKAIKAASGQQLRQWIRLYGDFQLTSRVRGN